VQLCKGFIADACQAAQHDKDQAGKTRQIAGEQSGGALRAEVAVECLAAVGDVATGFASLLWSDSPRKQLGGDLVSVPIVLGD
jgi:hypothetical protein